MKKRKAAVMLSLSIIFLGFTLVLLLLINNVSANFYKTRQQVIQTKADQFSKAFLVSTANIWYKVAKDSGISGGNFLNTGTSGSDYFTLTLNKGQKTEETIYYEIKSKAGYVFNSGNLTNIQKNISIDIKCTASSTMHGFKSEEKGLILEMEQ